MEFNFVPRHKVENKSLLPENLDGGSPFDKLEEGKIYKLSRATHTWWTQDIRKKEPGKLTLDTLVKAQKHLEESLKRDTTEQIYGKARCEALEDVLSGSGGPSGGLSPPAAPTQQSEAQGASQECADIGGLLERAPVAGVAFQVTNTSDTTRVKVLKQGCAIDMEGYVLPDSGVTFTEATTTDNVAIGDLLKWNTDGSVSRIE